MLKMYYGCLRVGSMAVGSVYMVLTLALIIERLIFYSDNFDYFWQYNIYQELILITTSVTLHSFLLYGAIKERIEFMLPWIIMFCIGLFYATILLIILSIYLSVYFLIFLLVILLMWLTWVVVLCHWLEGQRQAPYQNTSV